MVCTIEIIIKLLFLLQKIMTTIVVKGISLVAPTIETSHNDSRPTPYDLQQTMRRVENYLQRHGQSLVPPTIDYFPLGGGVLSYAAQDSWYSLHGCTVVNSFRPFFFETAHRLKIAAPVEKEPTLDTVLEQLQREFGWQWQKQLRSLERQTKEISEPGLVTTPLLRTVFSEYFEKADYD